MQICPAAAGDSAAIEALLDHSFGPERHQRSAYRLREGAAPLVGPTLVMRDHGTLVASVQVWPIALAVADAVGGNAAGAGAGAGAGAAGAGAAGVDSGVPLTLLGPIVVDAARHGQGIGTQLMQAALAAIDRRRLPPVLLIGDPEYYGRFGFSAAATAGWAMPGPVERHRLLLRAPAGLVVPAVGDLRPARRRPARLAA